MITGVLSILFGLSLTTRNLAYPYRFLGMTYLIIGYGSIVSFMLLNNYILEYPHFLLTASPFHYLAGPFNYFFVLFLLNPHKKWEKRYWLHFIPFALHLLELMPFYVLPGEMKKEIYLIVLEHKNTHDSLYYQMTDGLFSYRVHLILKSVQSIIYSLVIFRLCQPILKSRSGNLFSRNRLLLRWLAFDFCMKLTGYLLVLGYLIFYFSLSSFLQTTGMILFFIDSIMSFIFFLFNPKLLQGLKWLPSSHGNRNMIPANSGIPDTPEFQQDPPELATNGTLVPNVDHELYIQLEQYMQQEQPYLTNKINLNQVARALGVPAYRLSKVLNQYYDLNFPEYVNSLRLSYIDTRIKNCEKFRSYSFEAMAMEAGFNSKNAFYHSFRKMRGTTPSNFYRN